MRLTRRGRIVRNIAMMAVLLAGLTLLVLAWESGQNSQCEWYKQHDPQQARFYCTP